jgi:hypothetical protein
MKVNTVLLLLASVFVGKSLFAQECKGFFPFEPDTKLEMTYYDKKGKVSSISEITITDITETDGIIEAEIASVVKDKKGEEVTTGEYRIRCTEDGYEMDISNMLSPELLKSSNGMELDISGDALVFPNDLSVGKTLKDAATVIEVRSNEMKIMTMTFEISNRKVEAKESVTTTAGTFDCYKISYDMFSKVAFLKKNYHIVQWISDGVGVVKDETYGKKDKLVSSSELTKLEK